MRNVVNKIVADDVFERQRLPLESIRFFTKINHTSDEGEHHHRKAKSTEILLDNIFI